MGKEINNTTNDDLARMIAKEFEGVDRHFDKVEEKLDRVENALLKNHKDRIKRLEDALIIK